MTQYRFLATSPKGLGSLLVPEMADLGAFDVRESVAGVTFSGGLGVGYRACLHSRLANRIILQLSEFAASSADDLYDGIANLPWCDHLAPSSTLAIDFSGRSEDIRNTQFGAQRCKDAIVDVFRSRGLSRPNVDTRSPDLRIHVRLHRGRVSVGIDLSGNSLHQRGYRTDPGKAPLKENLAAAVLIRSGWQGCLDAGQPLIDPMCGSGTFLIEAAMMAMARAPGLDRERWGFHGWLGHSPDQWRTIEADGRSRIRSAPEGVELRGYDGDIRAIKRAEVSIAALGLDALIRVRPKALNTLTKPSHRAMPKGLIVCNPPWGERLGQLSTMRLLYRELGQVIHREFQGWNAGILTAHNELGRAVGLRSHKQYAFNNGAVDIQLLLFDLSSTNRLAPGSADENPHNAGSDPIKAAPEPLSNGATMLANRLVKNRRRLKSWLKSSQTSCYRLYDADMPEYAVAIDVYEGVPHVAEYAPPKTVDENAAESRFQEVLAAVRSVLEWPADQPIAAKRRQRQRGADQYSKMDHKGERLTVREGQARLLVNLNDYLDTGLFLDHRPLRLMLADQAAGKHFLNLFCYTGAATVHAALGGAATSTSVDLSNTYLKWFEDNLALNGLSERQHRVMRADCMTWLESCDRKFDLVLLDPPSFSNSKSTEGTLDIVRDQVALVTAAMSVLSPDGTLYFSNNHRRFELAQELQQRYSVEDITAKTIPEDFIRRRDIHRCWCFQHRPKETVLRR
ncbi:MAG: bifunctional 23S rRNA (guanine(2069)-N(7))-methyltransferase RlmK/23S rRNA (guanine(2445)-N(2))-methyltransferase RlmL [Luminiphilus sp.]|jgi:23S rRNA (guanine2445-N2)-methyltransferase / 23S rRNA (guanine2069-N7)-methyltransferase|nr:bifunctional 23S rRNA (guanine(2069)-N(7))-methyltransferase RlmK/23S rRNA (guanine(2445)-N(2))-methyltransferase RlmL [Luminiphilus sp.]MDG1461047.1 bifunctional 23S rRNA (guanine(2069)-N(7))-methyltransferase RlmK/23S rRNA (guanine(2445)-N(2))-methyltransferase RlmL [Luminiphilus sp.]